MAVPHYIVFDRRIVVSAALALLLASFILGALRGCADRPVDATSRTQAPGAAGLPATMPVGLKVERALIISIDGGRPDILLRGKVPYLRWMMENGAFSMWARTIEDAATLPAHTSMLTGVSQERHGIVYNVYIEENYPPVPTVFEQAKKAGRTTAMVAGKSKFRQLARPGTVDWLDAYEDGDKTNLQIAQRAVEVIQQHAPNVMFVHLPDTDGYGHYFGWGTSEQLTKVEEADQSIGLLLRALHDKGLLADTLVLVTADHGGSGWSHGINDAASKYIPWVTIGPGIRRGYDLTRFRLLDIKTEDTFATVCGMLRIPLPEKVKVDGRFVLEILEPSGELLRDIGLPPAMNEDPLQPQPGPAEDGR